MPPCRCLPWIIRQCCRRLRRRQPYVMTLPKMPTGRVRVTPPREKTLRRETCPDCQRPILVDRSLGMPVRADDHEIDQVGELLAVMHGVQTYQRRRIGFREWIFIPREPIHIDAGRRWPVYVKHRCEITFPVAVGVHPELVPAVKPYELSDRPPF